MEKGPDKVQLRRSWISTGEIIQESKDNLRVVSRLSGRRARNWMNDTSPPHYPTSNFRLKESFPAHRFRMRTECLLMNRQEKEKCLRNGLEKGQFLGLGFARAVGKANSAK